ncbi:MAG: hypothetical protein LC792_13290, partial [Actinobacteria bacterium]|nr:hypothetical protein [Actinomycetota bacterium]
MRVTLMADYCDWPLWALGRQLNPADLPLSEPTKRRIMAWLNAYDDEWQWDIAPWRAPVGLEGDADEDAWVDEGE